MTTEFEDPFSSVPSSRKVACIQPFMSFALLGSYYFRSADALVERMLADSGTLDVYIYAACYLYRHGIELVLKDLVWTSKYVLSGQKVFPYTHNLPCLWGQLRANAKAFLGSEFPLTSAESDRICTLMCRIDSNDPNSDSFRYPFDKDNKPTHPSLRKVGIAALRAAVKDMDDCFDKLRYCIGYHYDMKSNEEAEQG